MIVLRLDHLASWEVVEVDAVAVDNVVGASWEEVVLLVDRIDQRPWVVVGVEQHRRMDLHHRTVAGGRRRCWTRRDVSFYP